MGRPGRLPGMTPALSSGAGGRKGPAALGPPRYFMVRSASERSMLVPLARAMERKRAADPPDG